jgi:hypothetical protein
MYQRSRAPMRTCARLTRWSYLNRLWSDQTALAGVSGLFVGDAGLPQVKGTILLSSL